MTSGTRLLPLAIIALPLKSDINRKTLKTPGVYSLINILNGKSYIGSSASLYERLKDYYQPAYIASQPKRHINRAILKYGIESFLVVILEYTDLSDLYASEQAWIDSFEPEYNVLKYVTSMPGYKLTQEHKDNISKAITGKKQTAERRAAQSARLIGAGNPLWGRKHSEATKALMSLHAHKTFNKPGYAIEVMDLHTGIQTPYISMRKAATALNISRDTIKNHVNGKPIRGRYSITSNR